MHNQEGYPNWVDNLMSRQIFWIFSCSPFPLDCLSASGSSLITKECGNSDREPLKLNRNVWLSLRLSLEKLFLLGGGAMPRPLSWAWGDILRSDKLSTSSRSIFSLILVNVIFCFLNILDYYVVTIISQIKISY